MRMDDSEYNQLALESFLEDEERSRNDRLDRFIELNKLFGPQGDMLLQGGYQSLFALHEAGNSYVNGNYMAVILLSQAFIEHSLSGQFILAGEYAISESGFKRIIESATVTPSFVIIGLPFASSNITHLPLAPNVELTAFVSFSIPLNTCSLAVPPKFRFFTII